MERISSWAPWEQKVGYSRAVVKNGMVFISAIIATGSDGKIVGVGGVYTQVKTIFETIAGVLLEAGASFHDVVHSPLYLTDIALFEDAVRAHGEVFGDIRPAFTLLHVNFFVNPDMLAEIDIMAIKDK
ncbi:RidA family protein [Breoghania sp.]|uniref:RidA family protein n=1 Tax=Breoghania sp. TaxID=2065378 RepID=UPI00260BE44C|nr:RidA family protein [Breoghania sp.]MDJ0933523.1 RidA family protein [Breoghania sp.]